MLHNKRVIGTIGIMAGLPCNLEEFSWSYGNLIDYSNHYVCGPQERIELVKSAHSFHILARNQMADAMEGEWLLQLDMDHSFEPDLLARLLNLMNKYDRPDYRVGVVGGLYLHKQPPYNPTIWQFTGQEDQTVPILNWPEGEVLEVGVIGTGALLVKRWVFDRIEKELGEKPFSVSEYKGLVGEDFAFARRCRKLGIPMLVDPRIEGHHAKVTRLTVEAHYRPEDRVGA